MLLLSKTVTAQNSSSSSLQSSFDYSQNTEIDPLFIENLVKVVQWIQSSEKMNLMDTSSWHDLANLIKSSVPNSLQIRISEDNEKLRCDILELTQHTDIDLMAEKEDSMFHLANEENIHLKDKVVDLESGLNSLKNLVDKLTNEIAVKNNDIGSMAEKLTVMREESFLKVVQSN